MKKEAEQVSNNLCQNSNGAFSFLRIVKKEKKDLKYGSLFAVPPFQSS